MNRFILCIDLKSFYAFVECLEKKLDPFTTPLVVANKKQGDGAITLAISPFLKSKGVKSRGRLYEIPKNIKYMIAVPRMSLYIKKSSEVISIYLDFVSKSDLHVYSIDEAFLDITDYLKLYNTTSYELAKKIIKTIHKKTGLVATCGIGPNMFLAKVALDTDAKKQKDGIANWSYDDVKTKLWNITPLSNMWGIGKNMEKNLNKSGLFKVGDIANYNPNKLIDLFGVIGNELYNHANGIDESIIKEKSIVKRNISFSNSQILFKDYNETNISLIFKEMIFVLTNRLRNSNKVCKNIHLSIGYSKEYYGGFSHSITLDNPIDDPVIIEEYCNILFDKFYHNLPIRKVGISLGRITKKNSLQLNLFENYNKHLTNITLYKSIDNINHRFGKNAVLPATSLLEDSTILDRNKKIGGHNA